MKLAVQTVLFCLHHMRSIQARLACEKLALCVHVCMHGYVRECVRVRVSCELWLIC
jgi:hypothetical protein